MRLNDDNCLMSLTYQPEYHRLARADSINISIVKG